MLGRGPAGVPGKFNVIQENSARPEKLRPHSLSGRRNPLHLRHCRTGYSRASGESGRRRRRVIVRPRLPVAQTPSASGIPTGTHALVGGLAQTIARYLSPPPPRSYNPHRCRQATSAVCRHRVHLLRVLSRDAALSRRCGIFHDHGLRTRSGAGRSCRIAGGGECGDPHGARGASATRPGFAVEAVSDDASREAGHSQREHAQGGTAGGAGGDAGPRPVPGVHAARAASWRRPAA